MPPLSGWLCGSVGEKGTVRVDQQVLSCQVRWHSSRYADCMIVWCAEQHSVLYVNCNTFVWVWVGVGTLKVCKCRADWHQAETDIILSSFTPCIVILYAQSLYTDVILLHRRRTECEALPDGLLWSTECVFTSGLWQGDGRGSGSALHPPDTTGDDSHVYLHAHTVCRMSAYIVLWEFECSRVHVVQQHL